jgi:hypothetical protein
MSRRIIITRLVDTKNYLLFNSNTSNCPGLRTKTIAPSYMSLRFWWNLKMLNKLKFNLYVCLSEKEILLVTKICPTASSI